MAGRRKFPHTYVIVFYIILFAAFLTWVVPGGSFQRETVVVNGTQREVIAGGSYTPGESATPVKVTDVAVSRPGVLALSMKWSR